MSEPSRNRLLLVGPVAATGRLPVQQQAREGPVQHFEACAVYRS